MFAVISEITTEPAEVQDLLPLDQNFDLLDLKSNTTLSDWMAFSIQHMLKQSKIMNFYHFGEIEGKSVAIEVADNYTTFSVTLEKRNPGISDLRYSREKSLQGPKTESYHMMRIDLYFKIKNKNLIKYFSNKEQDFPINSWIKNSEINSQYPIFIEDNEANQLLIANIKPFPHLNNSILVPNYKGNETAYFFLFLIFSFLVYSNYGDYNVIDSNFTPQDREDYSIRKKIISFLKYSNKKGFEFLNPLSNFETPFILPSLAQDCIELELLDCNNKPVYLTNSKINLIVHHSFK